MSDDVKLKFEIISHHGSYGARFEVSGDIPERPGKLSVSRRPDHKFYSLSDLQAHNGSGPSFPVIEGARMLVQRVYDDFHRVLDGEDPSTDTHLCGRGDVWPKEGWPEGWTKEQITYAVQQEVEKHIKVEETGEEAVKPAEHDAETAAATTDLLEALATESEVDEKDGS
jgi:hypothetical protein